jgi:hypothetical protein
MIDLRISKSKLDLSVRFRDSVSDSAAQLATRHAEEFERIREAVLTLLSIEPPAPSVKPSTVPPELFST